MSKYKKHLPGGEQQHRLIGQLQPLGTALHRVSGGGQAEAPPLHPGGETNNYSPSHKKCNPFIFT